MKAQRTVVLCPWCRRLVRLRKDGKLAVHRYPPDAGVFPKSQKCILSEVLK